MNSRGANGSHDDNRLVIFPKQRILIHFVVLPSNLAGPGTVGIDAIATARSCGHTELQVPGISYTVLEY